MIPLNITFGDFNYLPFESAWSLFVKCCALNIARPAALIKHLARENLRGENIRYWLASDINDCKMASAIGVPYFCIRTGFIDNLVASTTSPGPVVIRHCPVCISLGYHSVFFLLHMIHSCPWHGSPLMRCVHCTASLQRGLVFKENKGGWSILTSCSHFYFFSQGPVRLHGVQSDQWRNYAELGLRIEKWLNSAAALGSPIVNNALSLYNTAWAKEGLTSREERLINIGLNLASHEIGSFPAPEAVIMFPTPPYSMSMIRRSHPQTSLVKTEPQEIFALYKYTRRYIYNTYVRPHAACYGYLVRLSTRERHALNSECGCSVAAAFVAWCLALRHKPGGRGPINLISLDWMTFPSDPREIMFLWIMHFYSIWSGIERNFIESCWGRDRFKVVMSGGQDPLRLGADVVYVNNVHSVGDVICYHPSPKWLGTQAHQRCSKRSNASGLLNFQAYEAVNFWCYNPDPDVLLRFWYGNYRQCPGASPTVVAG